MTNLTLSVDSAILQKAREIAVREQTSVNAVVREFLHQYVEGRSRQLEALDALDELAEHSDSRSSGRWSRESLHDR